MVTANKPAHVFRAINTAAGKQQGLTLGLILAAAAIFGTHERARAEDAANHIMNNSDFGNQNLAFETYPWACIKENQQVSDCGTDMEDYESSPSFGKFRYSCRTTRLTHLQDDPRIWKLTAIACRNGNTEAIARHKAGAASREMVFSAELALKTALGDRTSFSMDRERERCVRVDNLPPAQNTQPPAPCNTSPLDRVKSELPDDHDAHDTAQASPPDHPYSVKFTIHNRDRYNIAVKFFSGDRSYTWPKDNLRYKLVRDETYTLNCNMGQKVCYGASRDYQTIYWGFDTDGKQGCNNCCGYCGGEYEITLTDGGPDSYPSSNSSGGGGGVSANSIINMFNAGAMLGRALGGGGVSSRSPVFRAAPTGRGSTVTGAPR